MDVKNKSGGGFGETFRLTRQITNPADKTMRVFTLLSFCFISVWDRKVANRRNYLRRRGKSSAGAKRLALTRSSTPTPRLPRVPPLCKKLMKFLWSADCVSPGFGCFRCDSVIRQSWPKSPLLPRRCRPRQFSAPCALSSQVELRGSAALGEPRVESCPAQLCARAEISPGPVLTQFYSGPRCNAIKPGQFLSSCLRLASFNSVGFARNRQPVCAPL